MNSRQKSWEVRWSLYKEPKQISFVVEQAIGSDINKLIQTVAILAEVMNEQGAFTGEEMQSLLHEDLFSDNPQFVIIGGERDYER